MTDEKEDVLCFMDQLIKDIKMGISDDEIIYEIKRIKKLIEKDLY